MNFDNLRKPIHPLTQIDSSSLLVKDEFSSHLDFNYFFRFTISTPDGIEIFSEAFMRGPLLEFHFLLFLLFSKIYSYSCFMEIARK